MSRKEKFMSRYILMIGISVFFIILQAKPPIKCLPGMTMEETLIFYEKLRCDEDFHQIEEDLNPPNPLEVLAFLKTGDYRKSGIDPQKIMSS